MTRYFDRFYNIDPMVEISDDDARARGIYTVEDDVPMRRYRRFIDHELHTIVYAGWADPTKALADFRLLASGVPGQIFSPTTRLPHGGHSWICWYVNADGTVNKSLEPEFGLTATLFARRCAAPRHADHLHDLSLRSRRPPPRVGDPRARRDPLNTQDA